LCIKASHARHCWRSCEAQFTSHDVIKFAPSIWANLFTPTNNVENGTQWGCLTLIRTEWCGTLLVGLDFDWSERWDLNVILFEICVGDNTNNGERNERLALEKCNW
jgi:hypothetical protein